MASASALVLRYPPSKTFPEHARCNVMRLRLSTFVDMQLGPDVFSTPALSDVELPGMHVRLTGNVVDCAQPTLSYTGESLHGWRYYLLEYKLPPSLLEGSSVPELVIHLERRAVIDGGSQTSLSDTKMPNHAALLPRRQITNNPPVPNLISSLKYDLSVNKAERLFVLMRERLVTLEDTTGEFLYTRELRR